MLSCIHPNLNELPLLRRFDKAYAAMQSATICERYHCQRLFQNLYFVVFGTMRVFKQTKIKTITSAKIP